MKKFIYILAFSLVSFLSTQAQVDRSVQPKPGPAPTVNLGKAKSFQLPNGLTVLVVENHKLPRVNFSLTLDNPPTLEGTLTGINYLASNMMGNGTSKIGKDEFNEQIDYYGASVSFGVKGFEGSALSRYFPNVMSLVAQGALDPIFTQEELDSEKNRLIEGLKTQDKSASFIIGRVTNALLYGKLHPNGEFENESTIANITLNDVKEYYTKNFVPQNAYLVVVGDVTLEEVKNLITKDFSSWTKAVAPKSVYTDPVNLIQTEIDFIDVPTAVQAEIYVTNITNLKMTDPDYFATLLANQVLGGGADGRLFLNLRETHAWTYGSYSNIVGDKYISNFKATASVRNAVADSAVVEILNELNKIRTTIPTTEELNVVKAKYVGNFVMNAEKPQTVAAFALGEKTQSLPLNFYENYIKNINAVTLAQVQAAAKKHLLHNGVRIVIAGKASEVLPNLNRLNIPIKYFDKNANPTAKPEIEKPDLNMTALKVLENYINTIGGRKALEEVKTLLTISKGNVQGNEITIIQKSTYEGKSSQEIVFSGAIVSKIVFDGKVGYIEMAGQRNEMLETDIKTMKYAAPFPELLLLTTGIVKLGEFQDGAYVVEVGGKKYYYNKNTNLKTSEAISVLLPSGMMLDQKIYFSDYREVNGVKIPYKIQLDMRGMDVELTTTEVKINKDVSDADFHH